jgi:GNAT superfamily N-acetyltransferase
LEELVKMSARVRRLQARDKAPWLALFKGYIAFYQAEVAENVIETTWRRMLAGDGEFHIGLVAVDANDAPIGLAHVLFHRSTWSVGWYCYLEDLFVDPTRRRQGVGRALIEAVYREADARAASRTYWMTQQSNHAARCLYDCLATLSPFVQYRR